jgi:hypothetical protein
LISSNYKFNTIWLIWISKTSLFFIHPVQGESKKTDTFVIHLNIKCISFFWLTLYSIFIVRWWNRSLNPSHCTNTGINLWTDSIKGFSISPWKTFIHIHAKAWIISPGYIVLLFIRIGLLYIFILKVFIERSNIHSYVYIHWGGWSSLCIIHLRICSDQGLLCLQDQHSYQKMHKFLCHQHK